jgi:hypothetical protein
MLLTPNDKIIVLSVLTYMYVYIFHTIYLTVLSHLCSFLV